MTTGETRTNGRGGNDAQEYRADRGAQGLTILALAGGIATGMVGGSTYADTFHPPSRYLKKVSAECQQAMSDYEFDPTKAIKVGDIPVGVIWRCPIGVQSDKLDEVITPQAAMGELLAEHAELDAGAARSRLSFLGTVAGGGAGLILRIVSVMVSGRGRKRKGMASSDEPA